MQLLDHRLLIARELGDVEGEGKACQNLSVCYQALKQFDKAIELLEVRRSIAQSQNDQLGLAHAFSNIGNCHIKLGNVHTAIEMLEMGRSLASEVGDLALEGATCGNLGVCHMSQQNFHKAVEVERQCLRIFRKIGDRVGEGTASNNLGLALFKCGDALESARVLTQGLAVLQDVERKVGSHDDRRLSVFEDQQNTYRQLQDVLLENSGQEGWALGVASQAKARALVHRLGRQNEADAVHFVANVPFEDVCESWWREVQELARAEGSATRVVEYSFLSDDKVAIWVVSGEGKLLCCTRVASTALDGIKARTLCTLLRAVRKSMSVQGRDARDSEVDESFQSKNDTGGSGAQVNDKRGNKCKVCERKFLLCECAKEEPADESVLLRKLYQVLLEPVEMHLVGATELLLVPHKELFEVPWAALIDNQGRYLIERHILRVTPSLRVARHAATKMEEEGVERDGHVVVVGNPLPVRGKFRSLPCAEDEARRVQDLLNRSNVAVLKQHFFLKDQYPKATKTNVKESLQGASWAHFACHADIETDTLVLAIPADASTNSNSTPDLSMHEVQGTDAMEGVCLRPGSTVVLSACNTGRGDIRPEGVVGLGRGFLFANASATVVSLWSVDDSSTCTLMEIMYRHLVQDHTVPQALRLAMLQLAGRPAMDLPSHKQSPSTGACENGSDINVADSVRQAWKRPMHWAAFLVMGATTRLPRDMRYTHSLTHKQCRSR